VDINQGPWPWLSCAISCTYQWFYDK